MKLLNFTFIILFFVVLLPKNENKAQTKFHSKYDIIVAKDGSGNYKTVQEAFDAIPANHSKKFKILIKKGLYFEKITLPADKSNLEIVGEDRDSTILTYNDYNRKVVNGDTLRTPTCQSVAINANNVYLKNLTFQNTTGIIGWQSQAVAIRVSGDKIIFDHCRFIGDQDTYYTIGGGRIYHKNCYLEGTTDFIFGKSIAVFDSCVIFIKKNSHVTAANTAEGYKFGYVFRNCKINTADTVNNASLGRPFGPYSKVVYIHCFEDKGIRPEGWSVWNKNKNHLTSYYAEYDCYGPGFKPKDRVSWSHQLTAIEAKIYTLKNIFSAQSGNPKFNDNWLPFMIE
jgi:pectinesterase